MGLGVYRGLGVLGVYGFRVSELRAPKNNEAASRTRGEARV